jgi:hypothetical protein
MTPIECLRPHRCVSIAAANDAGSIWRDELQQPKRSGQPRFEVGKLYRCALSVTPRRPPLTLTRSVQRIGSSDCCGLILLGHHVMVSVLVHRTPVSSVGSGRLSVAEMWSMPRGIEAGRAASRSPELSAVYWK